MEGLILVRLVVGPLMALHNENDLGDLQAPSGVFFTAEIQQIRDLLAREEVIYRLFGGYSGWGPEQLEKEIAAGGWLLVPADSELIFGADTDAKYEKALRKIGIDLGMLSSEAGHA